jgi:hypothetical protein
MINTQKEFVKYVLSFYGKHGLYPIQNCNAPTIRKLIYTLHLTHFDTIDRELIRDTLFENSLVRSQFEASNHD